MTQQQRVDSYRKDPDIRRVEKLLRVIWHPRTHPREKSNAEDRVAYILKKLPEEDARDVMACALHCIIADL